METAWFLLVLLWIMLVDNLVIAGVGAVMIIGLVVAYGTYTREH